MQVKLRDPIALLYSCLAGRHLFIHEGPRHSRECLVSDSLILVHHKPLGHFDMSGNTNSSIGEVDYYYDN
ncbi:hypothetical protein PgNI_10957 [Pyricularia grisea]|uniref:Uncharacterized protein n=1 Tax=Pyricularia grisea TaxID=148305 RepID=A0A6P8AYZ4_PYRGI|nr:hypothetical protein PgNI_10957 [Pyricularia grisea]TLD07519.1 hypothetical protein PgNI_10957 [Pyricularia grisea]